MHYDQMEVQLAVNELIFSSKWHIGTSLGHLLTVFTIISDTGVWIPCRLLFETIFIKQSHLKSFKSYDKQIQKTFYNKKNKRSAVWFPCRRYLILLKLKAVFIEQCQ